MCEVHAPLASVPMVQPGPSVAWRPGPDRKPGLLSLTEEQYRALVLQEPFEQHYRIQETPISTGQWASVYKCLELSSGHHFAAKFCSKTRLGVDSRREILHEVAAMYQARGCGRVVRLHQVFETPHQFILVMELGGGGDLQGVLDDDQVPYEPDVVRFISNLLEGLAFLHDRNIAHLDIKPQNLVMTGAFPDCDIKLCDLEISRVISAGQEIREMLGTPDYVSPEILRFDPVTLAADMWSVGVLAYVLLTGFTPFGGDTDAETFRNIARAELEFPDELFEDVSAAAKDFIRRCLAKEPRERLTAGEALAHHWLGPSAASTTGPALSISQSSLQSTEDLISVGEPRAPLRRYISKSREALSVRVSRSNFKKNISKSRERLCDMKFVNLPMRPDQFPLCLRASTSDLPSNRPPWKGTGCGGPIPSASTTAINTFKLRDEYQNQVMAGLAASSHPHEGSGTTSPSPFVRHGSLRGRKKTSTPDGSSTDLRASLRRTRNTDSAMNRRNSSQEEGKTSSDTGKKKDGTKRNHSASEAPLHSETGSTMTKSPLVSVAEDKHGKEDVETFSDDDDVFTRLYKDYRKDVDHKSKLMSSTSKHIGHNDEEKENLLSATSTFHDQKGKVELIKSPVFPRKQNHHELTTEPACKIPNEASTSNVDRPQDINVDDLREKLGTMLIDSSKKSKQTNHLEPHKSADDQDGLQLSAKQDHRSAMHHTGGSISSTASSGVCPSSPRRQVSPRRRQTPSCSLQQSKLERRNTVDMPHSSPSATPSLRRHASLEKSDPKHQPSATQQPTTCHRTRAAEAVRLAAILDEDVVWEQTQTLALPTARGRPSVQSSRSLGPRKPREVPEPVFERSTLQRSSLRSSLRQTKPSRSGSGEESRRQTSSTEEPVRGLRKSSTEEDMRRLISRDHSGRQSNDTPRQLQKSSTEEDMRRLSFMEHTGRRSNDTHRELRKSSTESDVRRLSRSPPDEDGRRRLRSSSDWTNRSLRKSSTEEDVRRLGYERRPAPAPRRRPVPFLRSTSLTSDPGGDHSDPVSAAGELYNVTSWEERGEPGSGPAARATELRPVTTCRLSRRTRGRSAQPTPAPSAARTTAALSHDERPAGSVVSSTVSRAVKRFQALADESKQRDPPLKSPRSPRKTSSPVVQSPCVTRKCPSPAMRSLSPRGKCVSERATRPHGH
ncbi:probable serine/threonine-protein kinase MARK-C [Amphibalanus amphitrite]|uniref:probable serine/threonine-protein kinase MARK-C n=1 Tax=Amphibalanus amphitrite TaxID=1232801 RepID=UPI001C9005E3|nr:probable serine/threonine-protein kinase MARK-C [Amphibalanus amphitrite]